MEKGYCYNHTDIEYIYDFSPYESHNQYREGYEEEKRELNKQAQKVKDEVWLGDETEAQILLENFENF